ncbi:hypothetical protein QUF49_19730 [Fictibacillus sp. b24]|uniref:hypothetical protein n=1 Tax=Fictibacillus sp. b24 TaxID=3055863 RepID=UPI0025A0B6ED|nr:hypothetical protein [Fictibacillus sp. b24]MDM5318232.1 hypothetical protein [Fictibacillus sp. b24]
MRDSCGTSGTGETLKGAKRQGAHRPPRGKRSTWSGNQPLPKTAQFKQTKRPKGLAPGSEYVRVNETMHMQKEHK